MTAADRYRQVALASLAVAVLAGVWIRASLIWPGVLGPVQYAHALHAHSHLALFGWATAGLMGLLVPADARTGWFTRHATLIGIASALSFAGFLRRGYDAVTIAVAVLHVALWIAFVRRAWRGSRRTTALERTAMGFLALAGAMALLPGVATATGASAATMRILVETFLTTLIGGWVFLGSAGVLVDGDPRRIVLPLALLAVGTVPSALARVPGNADALVLVGRTGLVLTGAGSLLLAARMRHAHRALHSSARVLCHAAVAGVVLKGAVELLAALTPLARAMYLRPAAIAYLHLVLLGIATAALLVRTVAWDRVPRGAATLHVVGVAGMLLALAALAAGDLGAPLWQPGLTARTLQWVALGASAASAIGLVLLAAGTLRPIARHGRAPSRATTVPAPVSPA